MRPSPRLAVVALVLAACDGGATPDATKASASPPAITTSAPSTTAGTNTAPTTTLSPATTSSELPATTAAVVGCAQPEIDPEALAVVVYQGCGNPDEDGSYGDFPVPVLRGVAQTSRPMLAAFEALFAGPTAEESAAGYGSWFGPETAHLPFEVWIEPAGAAVLDLSPAFPAVIDSNVTTSSGGLSFVSQLFGTAFAFDSVETFEVRLDGDVVRFCDWFGFIPDCTPVDRAGWLAHYTGP